MLTAFVLVETRLVGEDETTWFAFKCGRSRGRRLCSSDNLRHNLGSRRGSGGGFRRGAGSRNGGGLGSSSSFGLRSGGGSRLGVSRSWRAGNDVGVPLRFAMGDKASHRRECFVAGNTGSHCECR